MINNVVLVGRLTKKSELKFTTTGTKFTNKFQSCVDLNGYKTEFTRIIHKNSFQSCVDLNGYKTR